MAIHIQKSDVAQKTIAERTQAVVRTQNDAASSKAKAEVKDIPSEKVDGPYDTRGVAEALFPDLTADQIDKMVEAWTRGVIQKHDRRLAYNAAYQRDLRTIKRLGLNCTVSVYRAGKYGEKK